MKIMIFLAAVLSFNLFAEECEGIITAQKINMKMVLADNLTRRMYEDYVNKGWLELGQDVYMQSSQGVVVNQMTRSTMNTLYNFHVMRLRDSLEPDYGSGTHINSEAIQNDFNRCLSEKIKLGCSNQLANEIAKIKEFEKFQNLYMSKIKEMVSLIDNFNSGVQSSGNAGQVYSPTEAYNYVTNLNNNIKITAEYKGWVNIVFSEAENAVNEASTCEYNLSY